MINSHLHSSIVLNDTGYGSFQPSSIPGGAWIFPQRIKVTKNITPAAPYPIIYQYGRTILGGGSREDDKRRNKHSITTATALCFEVFFALTQLAFFQRMKNTYDKIRLYRIYRCLFTCTTHQIRSNIPAFVSNTRHIRSVQMYRRSSHIHDGMNRIRSNIPAFASHALQIISDRMQARVCVTYTRDRVRSYQTYSGVCVIYTTDQVRLGQVRSGQVRSNAPAVVGSMSVVGSLFWSISKNRPCGPLLLLCRWTEHEELRQIHFICSRIRFPLCSQSNKDVGRKKTRQEAEGGRE